ncbi:hypothetical protein OSTOST_22176 [Ostertagia ostertagi]
MGTCKRDKCDNAKSSDTIENSVGKICQDSPSVIRAMGVYLHADVSPVSPHVSTNAVQRQHRKLFIPCLLAHHGNYKKKGKRSRCFSFRTGDFTLSLLSSISLQLPILASAFITDGTRTATTMKAQANELTPATQQHRDKCDNPKSSDTIGEFSWKDLPGFTFCNPSYGCLLTCRCLSCQPSCFYKYCATPTSEAKLDATQFLCLFSTRACTCSTRSYKATCTCPKRDISPYRTRNTFPLINKSVIIEQHDDTIAAHTSSRVDMVNLCPNSQWKQQRTMFHNEFVNVLESYSCPLGAKVPIVCYSTEEQTTADITCEQEQQVAICTKTGKLNEMIFHFRSPEIATKCTVSCPGGQSSFPNRRRT